MPKPVIAIQLEFGFHEIKKYIHSGFAAKLAKQADIVWFAIDKRNEIFNQYFESTGFPIEFLNIQQFNTPLSSLEYKNQFIRRAWMKNREEGLFHNYKKIEQRSWKEMLAGNSFFKNWQAAKTLHWVEDHYQHPILETAFLHHQITKVFSTGYNSTFAKSFYVTAHRMNIPTYYLVNSWKDLYTDDFIPFSFLNEIYVWDEEMKKTYLHHMNYLEKGKMHITGNPAFDIHKGYSPVYSRKHYCEKYGLRENSKWFLYTMMPPGLVNNESQTIQVVAEEILKEHSVHDVEIIIRKNPNHQPHDLQSIAWPENCALANHYCSYDIQTDMIIQSPEGETEWMDLLYHAFGNLSVPSTVTLECKILHKPVLNIAFNSSGEEDPQVLQHFTAGFYRPLFDDNSVIKVNTLKDLLPELNKVLQSKEKQHIPRLEPLASDLLVQHLVNS